MSEILKNKAKLEKLIMETWYDTNKGNLVSTDRQRLVVDAIKQTLCHFEMEDYLYGSNHVEIINRVYLSAKYTKKNNRKKQEGKKTKAAFSKELYIGRNTLSSNTNFYIRCFEKYFML